MKRVATILLLVSMAAPAADKRAKNIILFLGDAGGLPTLNAASAYAHKEPQKLFIQGMPNVALSDTSSATGWVSDSAAGMTAIVTGQKTHNGVISQGQDTERGAKDGTLLKTILEYAEERGLSTGVITNMNIADATPAACYAQANDRKKFGEIFVQVVKPRFGDGVDVLIGNGKDIVYTATEKLGVNMESELKDRGYQLSYSPEELPKAKRFVALFNGGDFDLNRAINTAIASLSQNPKGYFLMVEWDMHTPQLQRGLDRVITMDNAIRQTAERVKDDTLLIFTADHSFDLRLHRGSKGDSLVPVDGGKVRDVKAPIQVGSNHTGEEVIVAAKGPGSQRVKGFIKNTDIFHVMMAAYGWK